MVVRVFSQRTAQAEKLNASKFLRILKMHFAQEFIFQMFHVAMNWRQSMRELYVVLVISAS
tara:strand:+ start:497 stop:679 length:183 start_codon:yes stop_codon:yes gene_type:complete